MRIGESDLEDNLKNFENQNIIVKLDDIVEASFEMNKIHIEYNRQTGFLHIEDNTKKDTIQLNVMLAYYIDIEENTLCIKTDNSLDLKIIKK